MLMALQKSTVEDSPAPAPRQISSRENKRMLRARFDTQFTTDENKNHWQLADTTSVDAGANSMVRRTLRMRTRYEYHNNSYFQGIADTIGNYVIGTGPRLQMLSKNKPLNNAIEGWWGAWAKEIGLADTFKNSRVARIYNGEGFAIMRNNPTLQSPVKLDISTIEADQVSSPLFGMPTAYADQFFDGVVLDRWGRPEQYHILRQHPGAFGAFMLLGTEFDKWDAKYVLHDFKRIRPGQVRGIPEALPGLPLFAKLRSFTTSVVATAQTAADWAAFIHTTGPVEANESDAPGTDEPAPMDKISIPRNAATMLPPGYDVSQLKAEQPTTTYEMFTTAILREICRCMNIPLFFASMDATQANMSSAYVAIQPFVKSVQVDRVGYDGMLDRIFNEFVAELLRLGLINAGNVEEIDLPHTWRWPRIGNHADPMKTAAAEDLQLSSGTSSIPLLCADAGHDWEEVQEGAARSLGMTIDEYRAALREKMFASKGAPAPAALAPEPKPAPETETADTTTDEDE